MGYREIYDGWKADPEAFWLEAAKDIDWITPPSRALNDSRAPLYEWPTDATVNTCWNAVDRHVEAGRGNTLAIIHESPVTHLRRGITYKDLQKRVARPGRGPARQGRGKGRPRHHLHADGARGAGGDAGLCPSGRHPFGGVRRLCCQ